MKKKITIEVEISGHKKYTEDQINDFLVFEFNGLDAFEQEDVYIDDVDIDYKITNCKVEDL